MMSLPENRVAGGRKEGLRRREKKLFRISGDSPEEKFELRKEILWRNIYLTSSQKLRKTFFFEEITCGGKEGGGMEQEYKFNDNDDRSNDFGLDFEPFFCFFFSFLIVIVLIFKHS